MKVGQTPALRAESGLTIVELSISMVLAAFLAGAVVTVQHSSSQHFESSLLEHRVNTVAREGASELREELRSCLHTSIEATPYQDNNGQTILSFQRAISFNVANGTTTWGAGNDAGGQIEYAVQGTELIRRTISAEGEVVEQEVMMDNLDMNLAGGVAPVSFGWDSAESIVNIEVRREFDVNGTTMKRTMRTLVYIDPIFDY